MALQATRVEYRIALSQVDRGRTAEETLYAALHPSETPRHLTLRVLAWCLLHQDGLAFGPGLSTPDTPDLWAHDLTGRTTCWIECGAADPEALRKAAGKCPGAELHALFDEPRRASELAEALAGWKRAADLSIWTVDRALVEALAARTERRQRWTVTVVGDHLYVEADGEALDGPVQRSAVGASRLR
jgi:uncharacterized protein YaeQ